MKKENKETLIRIIPAVILFVAVGTITNYNLFYVIIAGGIGGLIGDFLVKLIKKRNAK